MVELLRRYSRQPHLWKTAKNLEKIPETDVPAPPRAIVPPRITRIEVRLGAEVIAQFVVDYEAGLEVSELQGRYGLSRGSVQRILREAGVKLHRQSLTDEQRVEVARLYESGLTIRGVAAELDIPKTTVQGALGREGVNMRPAARRKRET